MGVAVSLVLTIVQLLAVLWLAWAMLKEAEDGEWFGAFFYLAVIAIIIYV